MYIYILDKNLKRIGVIDNWVSLIWTTRYYGYGDFELYLPVTTEYLNLLKEDYYLETTESKCVMIIEGINIKTDAENGNYLTVSGRSVESLLDRRVICDRMNIANTSVEKIILNYLIPYNFTSPITDAAKRKMDLIAIGEPKGFDDEITTQYFGDNVYEAVAELCQGYGYGFRMPLVNGKFTFELYAGKRRTRDQTLNVPAVFSPAFENLVNTEYTHNKQEYKNVAFVAGEGEGSLRKTAFSGSASGIDRREIFVDARDLSSENVSSTTYYTAMLTNRGKDKLAETGVTCEYVGEVNSFPDYCELGDIVEVENEFGMKATTRITEIIESYSTSGNTRVPTFDEWSVQKWL